MIFHDIYKIKGKTVKLIYAGSESIVDTIIIPKPLDRYIIKISGGLKDNPYGFYNGVDFMNITKHGYSREIKMLICNKCLRIVDIFPIP